MAKNVFQGQSDYVDQPNRNVFDLSFTNALSMKFGALYPVFCKEVIPGDSFKIDTAFGLQFVPTYFPLQNKINANLHFFYVRNRNLWKDWQDFIGKTKKNLQPPVVSAANKSLSDFDEMFSVGSLGDYLGIPNTVLAQNSSDNILKPFPNASIFSNESDHDGSLYSGSKVIASYSYDTRTHSFIFSAPFDFTKNSNTVLFFRTSNTVSGEEKPFVPLILMKDYTYASYVSDLHKVTFANSVGSSGPRPVLITIADHSGAIGMGANHEFDIDSNNFVSFLYILQPSSKYEPLGLHNLIQTESDGGYSFVNNKGYKYTFSQKAVMLITPLSGRYDSVCPVKALSFKTERLVADSDYDVVSVSRNKSFLRDYKISALPFRAYESIYNAFYRDQFNDPFILNGEPEYNKFLPNENGGVDETIYKLHFRNWEKDFLTTCRQTPQQGNAPLVGVTLTGDFQFKDSDGNIHTVKPSYASDGKTIESVKFEEKTPSEVKNSMIDLITSGFTINDFRNVNALQRWLETNIRRGFRYKDQIMSHFGVDTRFDTLDMPEFIGGLSRGVSVNMVTNLAASKDAPLGDYAGQLYCNGDAGPSVSKYCDEHGFIVGILSVTPVPVYSQLLPKHFTKRDPMDYYFPEFAHIGMTPVSYSEVDPQGQYNSNPGKMEETFGYQRAWYEYLSSVDESHGEFKTTLRNFIMQRHFKNPPVLGHDFLQVKPDAVNDVFINTENNDKVIGQIRFNVMAKRPIPRFGIPKLEA